MLFHLSAPRSTEGPQEISNVILSIIACTRFDIKNMENKTGDIHHAIAFKINSHQIKTNRRKGQKEIAYSTCTDTLFI